MYLSSTLYNPVVTTQLARDQCYIAGIQHHPKISILRGNDKLHDVVSILKTGVLESTGFKI